MPRTRPPARLAARRASIARLFHVCHALPRNFAPRKWLVSAVAAALTPMVASADLQLAFPVDCTLGDTCFIQQYMDRDPGPGHTDFRCNGLSYDGHKGTDFALPTLADMNQGVDVLAAADGRVRGFRDGMDDVLWSEETAAATQGRECGNGVVLVHPGGWETQYCHLKKGSIAIQNGQDVTAGTVLGQIGLSGRTEFPHLHLSVRQGGAPIDPFDAEGTLTCDTADDVGLWSPPLPYQPGAVVSVGFTTTVPSFDAVKAGGLAQPQIAPDAPALVLYAALFGTRAGDVMRMQITGPNGEVIDETATLPRDHAQAFRAAGRRLGNRPAWPEGDYEGTATLIRDGANVSSQSVTMSISR